MSTYTQRVSSPAVPDLVGEVIDGRYEVLEHIADGGMAIVYLARDARLDREVALKVLRPHLVPDAEFVRRFEREARSAARLSHPHIVGVLDQGDDAGRLFIALEYVPGRTLRQVLQEEGSLTPRAALDILDPVLDALGHAHAAGFVHRDVKPENVLIREDGVVKVADFGLVRAVSSQTVTSSSSVLLGTVAYVSPEQVGRGIADARSDVYAAGLILFEMLTGEKAYGGDTPVNVAFAHVHEDVPKVSSRAAGTPPILDDLVSRSGARDPDERPVDGQAFRELVVAARASLSPAQLDRHLGATRAPGTDPAGSVSGRTSVLPAGGPNATTARLPQASAPAPAAAPVTAAAPAVVGHRRRRWPWVLVVLAALLLAATVWLFRFGPLTPTTIPVVAGTPAAQAHEALRGLGLTVRERQAYSEDVEAGVVIDSDPGAGTTVWRISTVDLIVSRGPERYAVPNLVDQPVTTAVETLRTEHLSAGTQTHEFSETVPEGHVIASDPAAGTPLPPGGAVNLVVSKGREPIPLANWVDKPYAEAEAALTAAGLAPSISAREHNDAVPKGAVISQQPGPGNLFRGDAVTFVVSEGPVLVAVPNVFGKQQGEATQLLKDAGFQVQVEKLFGGVFGTVRAIDPGAGTMLPKGSTVTIRIV